MWRAERHRSRITIGEATLFNLSISDACDLSAFELARRMDALEHLGAQFNAIGGFGKEKPFWGFEPETIVPGDENRLEELLLNGREWADTFATDGGTFVASIGGGPCLLYTSGFSSLLKSWPLWTLCAPGFLLPAYRRSY